MGLGQRGAVITQNMQTTLRYRATAIITAIAFLGIVGPTTSNGINRALKDDYGTSKR
jgi:hypothetical protein